MSKTSASASPIRIRIRVADKWSWRGCWSDVACQAQKTAKSFAFFFQFGAHFQLT